MTKRGIVIVCGTALLIAAAVMIAQIARGAERIEPVTDMYMIVDLSSNSTCRVSYRDSVPMGGWSSEYKKTKLVLRKIPQGTFKMGGYIRNEVGLSEKDAPFFCGEVRDVKISRPYYLGVFEVTQRQYEMVTGTNPYGLYDMHGNVFEWCIDRRAKYDDNVDVDPMNYGDSSQGHVDRVLRGGSGRVDARHCNSSFRWGASARARINEYGFRIAYCVP